MRKNLFSKLQQAPVSYIDSRNTGDLVSRSVADCENVSSGLLQGSSQLFSAIVTVICTLIAMSTLNVTLTIYTVIMTPLSLVTAYLIAKISHKMFRKMSDKRGKLISFTEEYVGNIKLVNTVNAEEQVYENFQKLNGEFSKRAMSSTFVSSLTNPTTRLINGIIYAVIAMLGAFAVTDGNLTVGGLVAFLAFANQYTKPFNDISTTFTEFQNAFASAKRIFEILNADFPKENPKPFKFENGIVEFKNVFFGYVKDKYIVKDFNFKSEKGQKIAIVGKTGSGKTTLINLLMKFYQPDSGEILLDGVNIKDISTAEIRKIFGMVLQDTWVFSGTIAENIAYSNPDATREDIIKAAKQAQLHKIVMALPKGYDMQIDSESNILSGGEKQLICIARLFLFDPKILILDEATSDVDIETEKAIARAFDEITKGRTSFIIAHREETIKNADVIIQIGGAG
jgi:ATP-binding cassette subfamily B protein